MTTTKPATRIVAHDREEHEPCQASTPGCCIDHEAEHRAAGWDRRVDSTCETW